MYEWDPALETGNETIDSQHKQLFDALHGIIEACRQGKGTEEIFRTMDFLTGYTIIHFATEEKLMVQCAYPEYLNHKHYHDELKVTVKELTQQLANQDPNQALIDTITSVIGDWLLNHIRGDDFRLAAYVKTCGTAET